MASAHQKHDEMSQAWEKDREEKEKEKLEKEREREEKERERQEKEREKRERKRMEEALQKQQMARHSSFKSFNLATLMNLPQCNLLHLMTSNALQTRPINRPWRRSVSRGRPWSSSWRTRGRRRWDTLRSTKSTRNTLRESSRERRKSWKRRERYKILLPKVQGDPKVYLYIYRS